jgi:hypothetical protein
MSQGALSCRLSFTSNLNQQTGHLFAAVGYMATRLGHALGPDQIGLAGCEPRAFRSCSNPS